MKIKKLVLSAVLSSLSFVFYEFVDIPIPPTNSPLITLSLGIIPIFFIAYYCGIYYSVICSIIVDIMGYLLVGASRGYAFNIGFTINAAIGGALIGLVLMFKEHLKGKKGKIAITSIITLFTLITIPVFIFLGSKMGVKDKYDNKYIILIITSFAILSNILSIIYSIFFFRKDEDINAINLSFVMYQFIVSLILTPMWIHIMYKTTYVFLWVTRLISVPLTFILYSLLTRMILLPLKKAYKENKNE